MKWCKAYSCEYFKTDIQDNGTLKITRASCRKHNRQLTITYNGIKAYADCIKEQYNKYHITCDCCGIESEGFDSKLECKLFLQAGEWATYQDKNENWHHICPECWEDLE